MSLTDCWPDWLKRRSNQVFGPGIPTYEGYPVFQLQPPVISDSNPNLQRANLPDAFYQYAAGIIATANVNTRIIHVMPAAVFDCITVTAFDDHPPGGGAATNFPVPILFSWDRPSRITTEVPFASTQEVLLATANPIGAGGVGFADPTIAPSHAFFTGPFTGQNGVVYYNTAQINSPRTNRPFYVWFGDGISTPPTGNAAFKIQWFTRGR